MKNSFNSWKLLTLLSSLIFAMSCWYLVYAAGTFDDWKVPNGIWNELDKNEWNSLMDSIWVPKWAVMAFDREDWCPTGWSYYSKADGRYIRWNYNSSYYFHQTDWASQIFLTVDQIPSHYHYIAREVENESGPRVCSEDDEDDYKNAINKKYYLATWNDCDDNYDLAWRQTPQQPNIWATSTAWKWHAVTVLDPYIYLYYCIKD